MKDNDAEDVTKDAKSAEEDEADTANPKSNLFQQSLIVFTVALIPAKM